MHFCRSLGSLAHNHLDEKAAQGKLLTILSELQRTIIRTFGVQNDVFFIKTTNTVTVGCGVLGRTVQARA